MFFCRFQEHANLLSTLVYSTSKGSLTYLPQDCASLCQCFSNLAPKQNHPDGFYVLKGLKNILKCRFLGFTAKNFDLVSFRWSQGITVLKASKWLSWKPSGGVNGSRRNLKMILEGYRPSKCLPSVNSRTLKCS